MTEEWIVKGRCIGRGKPLLCVPVVEQTKEAVCAAAGEIIKKGADMIEWRMDWYGEILDWAQAEQVLKELAGLCENTILLCTFRSRRQGGEREISQEEYQELLRRIARSGYADLLDVEAFEVPDAAGLIAEIQGQGTGVIASQHDFSHTPETECMEQMLSQMREWGAEIGKLAVMPEKNTDVLRLLEATAGQKEAHPDFLMATMAMGALGVVSRISGQIFGSCITFAAVGKTSAPGQLPLEDARRILEKISESIEGGE